MSNKKFSQHSKTDSLFFFFPPPKLAWTEFSRVESSEATHDFYCTRTDVDDADNQSDNSLLTF